MRLLIKQSVLLQLATVTSRWPRRSSRSEDQSSARVLRPGPGGHRARRRRSREARPPDVELDAKLFKAEVRLSDEVLEEASSAASCQTIMEMLADAIARDMEDVAINGDTAWVDPFSRRWTASSNGRRATPSTRRATPITKDLLRDHAEDAAERVPARQEGDALPCRASTRTSATATRWPTAPPSRPRPRLSRTTRRCSTRACRCSHPALPGEPRRGRRPDGHRVVQPEERPRRHLAKHPLRRDRPQHLGGHAEDRRHPALSTT